MVAARRRSTGRRTISAPAGLLSRRRAPCAGTDRTRTAGGRPMRGRGATRGLHAEHYRRADQPASLFLVAGACTAEACHDGGEKVLKALREFRVEGEPALHQRFRRSLVDVGHHLLLKLVHHRYLHRRDIREPDELANLEGCAIYLDVYFHVSSWLDFNIGPSSATEIDICFSSPAAPPSGPNVLRYVTGFFARDCRDC